MKVKDLVKRLEKFDQEAVVKLGGPEGNEVLFVSALAKDNKNVFLETAEMCNLGDEIATRFQQVADGEITAEQNYRNLIELGITAEAVKKVMGEEVYSEMMLTCVGGGLAEEMGREDLFDITQKMNLF